MVENKYINLKQLNNTAQIIYETRFGLNIVSLLQIQLIKEVLVAVAS